MKVNNLVTKSIAALLALTCVFGCGGIKVDNGPVTKKVFEETISATHTERWKLTDTKKEYKKYVNLSCSGKEYYR